MYNDIESHNSWNNHIKFYNPLGIDNSKKTNNTNTNNSKNNNSKSIKVSVVGRICPHKVPYDFLESLIRFIKSYEKKKNNDKFVKHVLHEGKDYFHTPITLPTNEIYYRKIIIEGSHTNKSHSLLANRCIHATYYAITFNKHGLTLYRPKIAAKTFVIREGKINEWLFFLYKLYDLNNKPLVIIGNRKIDRGIGFSYAPSENEEGLIWTDIIVANHGNDVASTVQVSGRVMGNISHSPQYPGNITIHGISKSIQLIQDHCNKTYHLNEFAYEEPHEAIEATKKAVRKVEEIRGSQTLIGQNHDEDICHKLFPTEQEAIVWGRTHLQWKRLSPYNIKYGQYNSKSIQRQLKLADTICPTYDQVVALIGPKLSKDHTAEEKTLRRKVRVVEGWVLVWRASGVDN